MIVSGIAHGSHVFGGAYYPHTNKAGYSWRESSMSLACQLTRSDLFFSHPWMSPAATVEACQADMILAEGSAAVLVTS